MRGLSGEVLIRAGGVDLCFCKAWSPLFSAVQLGRPQTGPSMAAGEVSHAARYACLCLGAAPANMLVGQTELLSLGLAGNDDTFHFSPLQDCVHASRAQLVLEFSHFSVGPHHVLADCRMGSSDFDRNRTNALTLRFGPIVERLGMVLARFA